MLEIEGFSKDRTIAIDHLEITKSLRQCDGKTFSLQCSCDHSRGTQHENTQSVPGTAVRISTSQNLKGPDKVGDMLSSSALISGRGGPQQQKPSVGNSRCTFITGVCEGMTLTQSHVSGPRWIVGGAGRGPLESEIPGGKEFILSLIIGQCRARGLFCSCCCFFLYIYIKVSTFAFSILFKESSKYKNVYLKFR